MAKKYLTLEEAAQLAGMSTDDLRHLREKGDLRGFADRGTWKFKQEDVEELARRRQTDSDPDVPMFADSPDEESSILRLDDEVGEQPTVIRGSALDDDDDAPLHGTSDSDVRLILDESLMAEPDSGAGLNAFRDSDSDVSLVGDSGASLLDAGSDSDVKLVGTDADIPLMSENASGSDSDVRLVEEPGSDEKKPRHPSQSDIMITSGMDSGLALGLDDDDDQGSSVLMDEPTRDSGVGLAAESGISLESLADSGISLEHADSGLSLGGDSDIALAGLGDSGIGFADDDDDDAITLADDRKKPQGSVTEASMPTRGGPRQERDDDTSFEIPAADDSEFELAMDDDQTDASVILFDDEDDVDERSATVVQKGRKQPVAAADDFDEFETTDSFDDDDEVVVASDLGEDEELDFVEAGDEDFDDEFVSGESQADFVAPIGGRMAAPVEQEWGTGTFVGLLASTALMAVCGVVMFDLVRYMWSWGEPSTMNSALLDMLGGLF